MSEEKEPQTFRAKSIQEIKKENKKNKKIKEIRGKKTLTGFVIVLCAMALVFLGAKLNRKCLVISVGDNAIGVVEDKTALEEYKKQLREKISKDIDVLDVEFKEEITMQKQKYDKTLISPSEKILEGLEASLTYRIKAYALNESDKEIALFENAKQLNRVLNTIRNHTYKDDKEFDFVKDDKKIEEFFFGNLSLTTRFAEKTELIADEIIISSLEEKREQKTYKVKMNDSITTIAEANDILVSDIVAANRGFTQNQILRVGQEINLVVPMARLPVITYIEQSYEAVVEPVVEKIIRDDQYEDYQNVIEEGKSGKKRVTVRIKMVDDLELETKTIKEEEIEKSEKKVIEVGSKKLPSKAMKGLFMMPTVGFLTSTYSEDRGTYNHKGIDIANQRGTEIYASYTGKVTFAGVNGGFGNVIYIEHSSGYKTIYAHLDEILVEKGMSVQKGDLIGKMGTTGNSTGNHLHFELHKDGNHKNPFDYIY